MKLSEKQAVFTFAVARLILELEKRGYLVTFGEAERPSEVASFYAKMGKGIKGSLHCIRLAIDLNLFKDGLYLKFTEEYREAGEVWEAMSTPDLKFCWGGHFDDGNHFSLEHDGVR